ncbi:MAG: hypothetical protein JW953_13400 [Anaerolineae bacterium]|nr:hypothetical protein [Anaerolineae bacterium]
MTLAILATCLTFGLIIIGNFAYQIYISYLLYKEQGPARIMWGIVFGSNRTFAQGWQQADELGIKNIMTFWSFLLTILVISVVGLMIYFAVTGPPAGR